MKIKLKKVMFKIISIILLSFFASKMDYLTAMEKERLIKSEKDIVVDIPDDSSLSDNVENLFEMARENAKSFFESWPYKMNVAFGIFFLIELASIAWFNTCRLHNNDDNNMSDMFCTSNYATFLYGAVKFSSLLPICIMVKGHAKFMMDRMQKFVLESLDARKK